MTESARGLRQPILLKLFFVFLVTGILILLSVAAYFSYVLPRDSSRTTRMVRLGLKQYTSTLADEIGTPPNYGLAKDLAAELGVGIRIDTVDGKTWQSSEDIPTLDELQQHQHGDARQIYFQVSHPGANFTFYLQPYASRRGLVREIMGLVGALSLILVVSFLVIRWLFRPINWLLDGVKAVSEGRLDYQMKFRPGDEFESLAIAFNQMAQKIKQMVQARERLLLDLSHELRSPLTRLKFSSQGIKDSALKDTINEDLNEMESMVQQVLESARLEHSPLPRERTLISLNALLAPLIRKYHPLPPGVHFTPSPSACMVMANPEELVTAFRNLLDNANKYSQHQALPVEVRLREQGPIVEIVIKDHGIGIPTEEQALIFEPFYRVDPSRTRATGGFGLGLNICQKIIQAHNGQIQIESHVGQGSTFQVSLPRA
jgi:signal transduction histidine kinase